MLRHVGALGLCCLLLTGCVDPQKQQMIAEENEKARDLDVRLVGDIVDVGNGGPMQVDGVGLVTGLNGTGHCPAGYYRTLLEQYLLKHTGTKGGEIAHVARDVKVRQILDDPANALVIVTGYIPPGAHRGERFDVNIKLPPASRTTSLAGGYLQLCPLRVYESAAKLSNDPKYQNSQQLLPGHIYAHAKGSLVVGFGANADANELKSARVWQGGVSRIDRPYTFAMKKDNRSLQFANKVAGRINLMHEEDSRVRARHADFTAEENHILAMGNAAQQINAKQDPSISQDKIAKASKESVIYVRVPTGYRFDHQRFIDVAARTPQFDDDPDLPRYQQRLQKMLLDPRDTRRAAIHLEALGRDSIPILKTGLESAHPFVRFCSAESLAYLSSTAGVDTLAQLAPKYPIFAKNCTIALANLNENICRDRLGALLTSDERAVRCAAFHALSLVDEKDARLGGICLHETFWLYRVPDAPEPTVYFSTSKRAQVVLFGKNITLQPGTRVIIPKDFTVAHDEKSGKFLVKRITARGEQQRLSSGNLGEILSNLAELGATYPEIVDFLRRVEDYQKVNCPILRWITPEVPLEKLVEAGRNLK